MKDYKEFTPGWIIIIIIAPVQILMTYWYINDMGDRPLGTAGFLAITSVLILVGLLFYGMTTRINSEAITVSFGIGFISKRIPLSRIKSVSTVKSPWYYGKGIRIIPNGMQYSISGRDGVEIQFNDTDRIIRIGSRDAVTLKNELEKRMM